MTATVVEPGEEYGVIGDGQLGVFAKLADIRASVEVKATGVHEQFGYSYLTADDVELPVRAALAKGGLHMHVDQGTPSVGMRGDMRVVSVPLEITIVDVTSGAAVAYNWHGEDEDKGAKGLSKAVTSGMKQFWITQLQLSKKDAESGSVAARSVQQAQPAQTTQPQGSPHAAGTAYDKAATALREAFPKGWPMQGSDKQQKGVAADLVPTGDLTWYCENADLTDEKWGQSNADKVRAVMNFLHASGKPVPAIQFPIGSDSSEGTPDEDLPF